MHAEFGDLQFHCDLRDLLMREVCLTGCYEPQETTLVQHLLAPGMTFVDVGANWGYFTLVAAHLVGSSGRVLAVEADPRAARTVRENVARNSLAHVTVIEAAASDVTGSLLMQSYGSGDDDSSNFGLAMTPIREDGGRSFAVSARPLDDCLDECGIEHVDLMKIDIEGAEARALTGLQRHLAAGQIDRLIVELHPEPLRRAGTSCERVISTLGDRGYRAWRIDHSPQTYRRAASTRMPAASLMTPLHAGGELGEWPHVLFVRVGLSNPQP